jgi:hypothetical protein
MDRPFTFSWQKALITPDHTCSRGLTCLRKVFHHQQPCVFHWQHITAVNASIKRTNGWLTVAAPNTVPACLPGGVCTEKACACNVEGTICPPLLGVPGSTRRAPLGTPPGVAIPCPLPQHHTAYYDNNVTTFSSPATSISQHTAPWCTHNPLPPCSCPLLQLQTAHPHCVHGVTARASCMPCIVHAGHCRTW